MLQKRFQRGATIYFQVKEGQKNVASGEGGKKIFAINIYSKK